MTELASSSSTSGPTSASSGTPNTMPALFVNHGGGPMPLDPNDTAHVELKKQWKECADTVMARFGRPTAIAVVSAHYNTDVPAVTIGAKPKMLYDYYGFSEWSYQVEYPARGHPDLAAEAASLLTQAGFPKVQTDEDRGFDHGVFIPLMFMFPKADIPVVPISVLKSEDPNTHIAFGRALAPLRRKGVLILGSGATSHNMQMLMRGMRSSPQQPFGTAFHNQLLRTVTSAEDPTKGLADFTSWEGASECQAKGATEHFLPLITCLGSALPVAASSPDQPSPVAKLAWRGVAFGHVADFYWFGEPATLAKL